MKLVDLSVLENLFEEPVGTKQGGGGCGDTCNGVICGGNCLGGWCGYSLCPNV